MCVLDDGKSFGEERERKSRGKDGRKRRAEGRCGVVDQIQGHNYLRLSCLFVLMSVVLMEAPFWVECTCYLKFAV